MSKDQIVRFIPLAERYPEEFMCCLLITKSGSLSVGRWTTGTRYPKGAFSISGGIWDPESVRAWIPIEQYKLNKGDKIVIYYDEQKERFEAS